MAKCLIVRHQGAGASGGAGEPSRPPARAQHSPAAGVKEGPAIFILSRSLWSPEEGAPNLLSCSPHFCQCPFLPAVLLQCGILNTKM